MLNFRWAESIVKSTKDNSPVILTAIASGGVVITAFLAARAVPKAQFLIDEAATEIDDKKHEIRVADLPWKDKVRAGWKPFIPATLSGAATIFCIIGAHQAGSRRNAALLSAYTLVDTAFREYKDKVVEEIGTAKERKIHDKIVEEKMKQNPPKDAQVIITGGGDQLCYDSLTGRYFKSDAETIRRAENETNRQLLSDMFIPHNYFYEILGLAPTTVGDELGWNIENHCEVVFTSHLAEDGRPCLAVGYQRLPRRDYEKF